MNKLIKLLVKGENPPGPVELQLYDEEVHLDVRELTTRVVTRVRARDVSCYLHTLFVGGRTYKILNILKGASHSY